MAQIYIHYDTLKILNATNNATVEIRQLNPNHKKEGKLHIPISHTL